MPLTLTPDTRARLDAHLDAVEAALGKAGTAREQRRAVVDDLEAQILDMLAARSATPTSADVDAVLATLDPPAAYGNSPPAAPSPSAPTPMPPPLRPRYSRTAIWGLVCIMLSFFPALLMLLVGFFFHTAPVRHTASEGMSRPLTPDIVRLSPETEAHAISTQPMAAPPDVTIAQVPSLTTTPATPSPQSSYLQLAPFICAFVAVGPLGVLGTILGWIAFAQIRRSNGTLTGRGLALFDGLFWPVVMLIVITSVRIGSGRVISGGGSAAARRCAPCPEAAALPGASA